MQAKNRRSTIDIEIEIEREEGGAVGRDASIAMEDRRRWGLLGPC